MVAITVILAAVVGVFATGIGGELNKVSGNAKVDFDESPVGLEMTVETISTSADVRLNGETVATIDEDDTGRTVLLPTAPGDRVTVVSGNDQQSVLVDKTADDRSEIGDFIFYWDYSNSNNDKDVLQDLSGNGNDAEIRNPGNAQFREDAIEFDQDNDHGAITSIDAPVTVDEFTLATTVTMDGSQNSPADILAHTGSGTELGFEIDEADSNPDKHKVRTEFNSNTQGQKFSTFVEKGPGTHTYILTYDGEQLNYFVDGQLVDTVDDADGAIDLGSMQVARDKAFASQQFVGQLNETRMYYQTLDEEDIEALDETMR
jgi:hypothetical protein